MGPKTSRRKIRDVLLSKISKKENEFFLFRRMLKGKCIWEEFPGRKWCARFIGERECALERQCATPNRIWRESEREENLVVGKGLGLNSLVGWRDRAVGSSKAGERHVND